MAYDLPASGTDDMFDISKTTAAAYLQHFCSEVTHALEAIYFREPTRLIWNVSSLIFQLDDL